MSERRKGHRPVRRLGPGVARAPADGRRPALGGGEGLPGGPALHHRVERRRPTRPPGGEPLELGVGRLATSAVRRVTHLRSAPLLSTPCRSCASTATTWRSCVGLDDGRVRPVPRASGDPGYWAWWRQQGQSRVFGGLEWTCVPVWTPDAVSRGLRDWAREHLGRDDLRFDGIRAWPTPWWTSYEKRRRRWRAADSPHLTRLRPACSPPTRSTSTLLRTRRARSSPPCANSPLSDLRTPRHSVSPTSQHRVMTTAPSQRGQGLPDRRSPLRARVGRRHPHRPRIAFGTSCSWATKQWTPQWSR